jgi:FkbM family methyltransferase
MKKIFFDVGANYGTDSIHIAEYDKESVVYAFEPTPVLFDYLIDKTKHLSNYHVIKKAVSDYNGKANFNIAGQSDWGCSSLLEFSEKSKTEWIGRDDFKVTEVIEVDVIRLDDFIIQNNITHIDNLHVDTQGSDLNVLLGLGDKINIVKNGKIEAATKNDILYKEQNLLKDCVDFLDSNNFEITNIWENDIYGNEVNIEFKEKKKRIAVFLSGRISGHRNDINLKNILKIKEKYNPIFFISLNKSADDSEYTNMVRKILNVDDNRFQSFYTEIPSEIYTFIKAPETNAANTYSQFKHNNECIKMIDKYQKENKIIFDTVVKYRMDIYPITENIINLNLLEENTCFIPEGNDHRIGINDQIGYGNFNTMLKYCNLIENINKLCISGVLFHPETLLLSHLHEEKINIKRFNFEYWLLKN